MKKARTISIILAGGLVLLALIGYFVIYPFISVIVGDYYVYIDMYNVKEFDVPEGVERIGDSAFENCDSLTTVTIPNSVTIIEAGAFRGCTGLTNVNIGNSVTSIGDSAFSHCKELTSITIPDSVTSIEEWAFSYCEGLTSITIPDSVTYIGEDAFYGCKGLKIWCEASEKPSGWNSCWDIGIDNSEVHWGNTWHYINGEPTLK